MSNLKNLFFPPDKKSNQDNMRDNSGIYLIVLITKIYFKNCFVEGDLL